MNALEKPVPKELEQHLLLNFVRFKNFEDMEREVVNYMEAKTGNKMVISLNFSKAPSGSGVVPMDVDSLMKVVSGSISSLTKTKGDGKGKGSGGGKPSPKLHGNCDKCGKYGHRKKDCWSKDKSGGKGGSSSHLPDWPATAPRRRSLQANATTAESPVTRKLNAGRSLARARENQGAIRSPNPWLQLRAIQNLNLLQPVAWSYVRLRWTP